MCYNKFMIEKSKTVLISPSILTADFANMACELEKLEDAKADYIHCDVMDGCFVPNITFGFKMISDIKKRTKLPLDVHLMIDSPSRYVERFADSGADIITIHIEAEKQIEKTLNLIKNRNIKAGIVINPDTPVSAVVPYVKLCDIILLMSVFPGFGGQSFIDGSLSRLRELRTLVDNLNPNALIEIDGGVGLKNAEQIREAGADILVAGNAIFSSNDYAAVIKNLRG